MGVNQIRKIILDTNVVQTGHHCTKLPNKLQYLCDVCKSEKIDVVLPSTTILEWQRKQDEFVVNRIDELNKAYAMLTALRIKYEATNPADVIVRNDLCQLFKECSFEIAVVEPTFNDFKEAHNRACLHLSPTRNGKSDEMRDHVIWSIAMRVAKANKGTLLISEDTIFSEQNAIREAEACSLFVVQSVEKGIEAIGRSTPSGDLVRSLIAPVFNDIVTGLSLSAPCSILTVYNCRFIQGEDGPAKAFGTIIMTDNKKTTIKAEINISKEPNKIRIEFNDVFQNNAKISNYAIEKVITPTENAGREIEERLNALKSFF